MTPIPKVTKKSPVSPEKYYTNMHAQAHGAVVETIKHLKSRWKCLQANCNKQFDPPTVAMMIVACCVLHNMCNRRGLPVPPMTQTEERLEAMKQKVANGPIPRKVKVEVGNGVQARARLVERLWNERRVVPECGAPKKRMPKKDRVLENHQTHVPPPPPQQPHHHQQQIHHQTHHEDMSKRPRIISMTTPTYSIGVPPGWGHYPQH